MSMERKFTKYMLDEIEMAEHYIRTAKACKDQTVATKLHEMAKDELRHYDFLHTQLEKMHNERLASGETAESVYKDSYDIFEEMYHHWEEKVAYEVNTFVFKK